MIKWPFVIAWILTVCFCVWVEVAYSSMLGFIVSVVFVALPAFAITSVWGIKKKYDDEGEEQ